MERALKDIQLETLLKKLDIDDPMEKILAIRHLGILGDAGAFDGLANCLREADEEVRKAAAEALGRIGDPRAIEPLAQALKDSDADVREASAKALGRLGNRQAVGPLTETLPDHDKEVRKAASLALEGIGESVWIRGSAEDFRHTCRNPHERHILDALLKNRRKHSSQISGSIALVHMLHAKGAGPSDEGDSELGDFLVGALESRLRLIRRHAAEALAALDDLHEASRLYWILFHGSDEARTAAAWVLGKIGDASSVPFLVKVLRDPDREVRIAAVEALARLGKSQWQEFAKGDSQNKDAIEQLACLLEDPNPYVRQLVAETLVILGESHAAWALSEIMIFGSTAAKNAAAEVMSALMPSQTEWASLPMLFCGEKGDRLSAVKALEGTHDPSLNFPLRCLLGDPNASVRVAAAKSLANRGEEKWGQWITGDPEDFVRLGESRDRDALAPLIRTLGSADEAVRRTAKDALIRFTSPEAVEMLVQVLISHPWEIRVPIAEILGERRDQRAVDPLIQAFSDYRSSGKVRIAAARALGTIGDPRAVEPLTESLKDLEAEVRPVVLETLARLGRPAPSELLAG